ncbi:hypothetical protein D3C80_1786390 [compost metagenome]
MMNVFSYLLHTVFYFKTNAAVMSWKGHLSLKSRLQNFSFNPCKGSWSNAKVGCKVTGLNSFYNLRRLCDDMQVFFFGRLIIEV